MAMENQFTIRDTHSRPITALGYHPLRRDIFVGYEGSDFQVEDPGSSLDL